MLDSDPLPGLSPGPGVEQREREAPASWAERWPVREDEPAAGGRLGGKRRNRKTGCARQARPHLRADNRQLGLCPVLKG